MNAPTTVTVDDVFVVYPNPVGAVMALRGLQLDVRAGEHLLVHGPNGSGKSTLLRVITAEQPVLAGRVWVGNDRIDTLADRDRRRWQAATVGFVDQHVRRGLLPELSVLDNVALHLELLGTPRRAASEQTRAALERFRLSQWSSRTVGELSGGEAQRVAVCAAVAHRPQLVLADEPTGELDESTADAVYRLLADLTEDGTTVVLVSHDPRAERCAHRVVRIRDGRVAEQWQPGGVPRAVPDSRGWTLTGAPESRPSQAGVPTPATDPTASTGNGPMSAPAASIPAEMTAGASTTPVGTAPRPVVLPSPLLSLRRVAAGYGGDLLFPPLDLAVHPGTMTLVAGPSGAGKSTLLAMIAGLLNPLAGVIEVDGRPWADLNRSARARWRRDRLAFAPQRPSLVEPLTVRENLDLARSGTAIRSAAGRAAVGRAAVGRAAAGRAPAMVTVERLGLAGLLDQQVRVLSGGERQRVGLACCLVRGSPLLVADEPTTQQDEQAASSVRQALLAEVASGRAVVVATQDPELLSQGHVLRLTGRPPLQVGAESRRAD